MRALVARRRLNRPQLRRGLRPGLGGPGVLARIIAAPASLEVAVVIRRRRDRSERGAVDAAGVEIQMRDLINLCRRFLAAESSPAGRYLAELTDGTDPACRAAQPLRWVHRFSYPRLVGDYLPDTDPHRG